MKPDHVEESAHGMTCRHCGGIVGEDGYSEVLGETEEFEPFEREETDQHAAGVKMRHESGFVDAMQRRRHSGGR